MASSLSSADVDRCRLELPATGTQHYLNTGTCGPLPRRTVEIMQRALALDLSQGRIGAEGYPKLQENMTRLRARLESLLGAPAGTVAITHHTTEGMNIAIGSQPWSEGDELLTTNREHIGGLAPAFRAAAAHRIRITSVDSDADDDTLVARLDAAISEGTRLVVLSHVAYATGARLPLKQITAMAHRHGVLVAVDAAQSAGAIPTDVLDLDVDYLALPGQKWLLGPEGVGALYVKASLLATTLPPLLGGFSVSEHDDVALTYQLHGDARRFEVGSVYRPGIEGFSESLRFFTEDVGASAAMARIATQATQCYERLEQSRAVHLLTPKTRMAGLLTFTVADKAASDVVAALAQQNVIVRSIAPLNAVRVSMGFYNNSADVDALAIAIERIARS